MANSALEKRRREREQALQDKIKNGVPSAEPQDVEPQEKHEAPHEDDIRERFERLSGKVSGLEKTNHAKDAEIEALRAELEALKNPPKPQKSQEDMDKELEDELRKEVGADEWDYLDDAQRKVMLAIAKRGGKRTSDVDEKIQTALQERDNRRRSQTFIEKMDAELSGRGVKFLSLMNDERFNEWVGRSRKRLAIFEAAMEHRDDEAKQDISDLIHDYYAEQGKPNKGTPPVKPNQTKAAPKSDKISHEEYVKALRDKRHPGRREKARAIIAAYKKQEGIT